VWLDPSGKQLLQWPVAELEKLRSHNVQLRNQKLYQGYHVEVKGITAAQVCFVFLSLSLSLSLFLLSNKIKNEGHETILSQ
jgi:predicted ABC-type transport system involved in lysophospholipase L1 biosynthesis ATPase subunit